MFKMALKNIFRNKRRSILSGLTIIFAVMMAIYIWSLINGVIDEFFDNTIRLTTGHIKMTKKEYSRREKILPININIDKLWLMKKIMFTNSQIKIVTGQIKFGVLLEHNGKNKPVIGIGIEPENFDKISNLSNKMIKGRILTKWEHEMNIGSQLADELDVHLGDVLTILTQTAYGSVTAMNLKIVGIFNYSIPSIDNRIFYMHVGKASELLDIQGKVTEILAFIKNMNQAPIVAKEIQTEIDKYYPNQFVVVPWQDQGAIVKYMKIAKYIYGIIYFMVLFLASFTIFNTMFMAVLERKKEIGMMKALGLKDFQIIKLILFEAMIIGIIASFIGAILGAGVSYYLAKYGIDFHKVFEQIGNFKLPISYIYRAKFDIVYILTGFCMGVIFSIIATIFPAIAGAKISPVESLREI